MENENLQKNLDIVFTFVNDGDSKWVEEFENEKKIYNSEKNVISDSKSRNRFNNSLNELYFSILSMKELINSELIHKIYIVISSLSQMVNFEKTKEIEK